VTGAGVTWNNTLESDGSIQVSGIITGPTLTTVSPNPVPGSSYAVPLGLVGSGFTGATAVLLTNLTTATGASYVPTVNSDNSISITFVPGTVASSWNATVVNGTPSTQVGFNVTAPSAVTIDKTKLTSAGAGKIVVSGTGMTPNYSYAILSTTSLTPPVIWTPIATDMADGSGNFNYTNLVNVVTNKLFLRIQE